MPQTQLSFGDVTFDARRALWMGKAGVLAIADIHLGYTWAQRHRGFLFPVSVPDHTLQGLRELQKIHQPRTIVLLGDIVHRAVPVPALETALKQLVAELGANSELVAVRGNHDRDLEVLLENCELPVRCATEFSIENYRFLHGDFDDPAEAEHYLTEARQNSGKIIMGHEHPAITLSAGPASFVKCPCFLISQELIILPAFSNYAAGVEIRKYPFMSPLANAVDFIQAVAVLGNKVAALRLDA